MRRTCVSILLLGALLALPLSVHAAVPRVLVLSGGLVSVGFDGSDPLLLADAPGGVWSPDGRRVAYVVRDFNADTHALRIVQADGSGDRLLAEGPGGMGPVAWHPDGRTLAVGHGPEVGGDPGGLWLYDAEDGTREQVHVAEHATHSPWELTELDWSPDGTQIAATRAEAFSGNPPSQLVVFDRASRMLRALTDRDGAVQRPSWSPGGDRLLFLEAGDRWAEDSPRTIEVIRSDGSERRVLHTGDLWSPGWSPDGTTIAFTLDDALHLMAADGTHVRQVLAVPEVPDSGEFSRDILADWSPDGNYLGFTRIRCCTPGAHGGNPTAAHTVRVDGSELRRVGEDGRSLFGSFAPAVPVSSPPLVTRVAGQSREATAAALSASTVQQADAVVIARSDDYADALTGGPLAAHVGGPMLLTPSMRLHPSAEAEVRRLGPATAYLLGGPAALSPQVEADLRAAGVEQVVRVAGTDRFDTARRIAELVGGDHAYVVEGRSADPKRGWPDAVAAGPLAAQEGRPILLVEAARLPDATAAALQGRAGATIVGGTAAVSAAVEQAIADLGVATDRLAGPARYDTAAAVADRAVERGADPTRVFVASGADFPDALAAGPVAAAQGAVLLLVAPGKLTDAPAPAFWIGGRAGTFAAGSITVVGGAAAVSPAAAADLDRWAQ